MVSTNKASNKASKISSYIAATLVAVSAVAAVILVCTLIFKNSDQRTSEGPETVDLKALECSAVDPAEAFFASTGAVDVEHQLKVTYRNGLADKVFYTYWGNYGSVEAAEQAEARLHADYNIYMGSEAESFTPTFAVVDEGLRIALFTPASELGSATSRMFFINQEEFMELERYDVREMQQIFERKGFSCKMAE